MISQTELVILILNSATEVWLYGAGKQFVPLNGSSLQFVLPMLNLEFTEFTLNTDETDATLNAEPTDATLKIDPVDMTDINEATDPNEMTLATDEKPKKVSTEYRLNCWCFCLCLIFLGVSFIWRVDWTIFDCCRSWPLETYPRLIGFILMIENSYKHMHVSILLPAHVSLMLQPNDRMTV